MDESQTGEQDLGKTTTALTRVVLGVTGGIAAYKAAELVRLLVKAGVVVDVILTDAGARFVTATTFQALSGRPVLTDLWQSGADNAMGHIAISRGNDSTIEARGGRFGVVTMARCSRASPVRAAPAIRSRRRPTC